MNLKHKWKWRISSFQLILLGFAAVILLGALILMLPISSRSRVWTPFTDALFTATSAVCVTGLVVHDTATYWSVFGQIVLLVFIQIGGMGVVTVASSFLVLSGKKIGLFSRGTLQEAVSAPNVGGIVRLIGFILKGVFLVEGIGAVLMIPSFCIKFGAKGIWMAIFHSVSAFCNAGFDIMGSESGAFSSFTMLSTEPVVNIVIMLLIILGGIGFLVWDDVCQHRFQIRKYRMQSKVVLLVTLLLILCPALYFYFCEFNDLPLGERILTSLFQSVTLRTAGFNTVSFSGIGGIGLAIMIVMMLIGGSPGSTAGGMKTTTPAVLFASVTSIFRKKDHAELMSRRIDPETVKNASAILLMYLTLFLSGGMLISGIEGLPLTDCLYEAASAIGTVGLTLGITPQLGTASRIILILFMFFGRVGGLTLIYAAFGKNHKLVSKFPLEKITVG